MRLICCKKNIIEQNKSVLWLNYDKALLENIKFDPKTSDCRFNYYRKKIESLYMKFAPYIVKSDLYDKNARYTQYVSPNEVT